MEVKILKYSFVTTNFKSFRVQAFCLQGYDAFKRPIRCIHTSHKEKHSQNINNLCRVYDQRAKNVAVKNHTT